MKLKAVFVLFLMLLITVNGKAQEEDVVPKNIKEGNFLVGGSAGLGYGEYSGLIISISPTFGYFPIDNFLAGLELSTSFSDGGDDSSVSAAPFARYYFWEKERWAMFGHLAVDFYMSKNDGSEYNNETGVLGLGADYFLTERIALEGTLKYYRDFEPDPSPYYAMRWALNIFF